MIENKAIRQEDNLWKVIMEELFADFIRFVHPGIDQVLDLDRGYQFLDKELEQVFPANGETSSSKLVDKLVRVYSHEGKEEFVLLHFEFQAQYRADFGKRMFTYFSRLMDKYNKPISAYAIFTEATKKERPGIFSVSFLGTELNYKFNTYKISAPTDEELLTDTNPFAMVVLAARGAFKNKSITNDIQRDNALKELKIDLMKRLIATDLDAHKKKCIFIFIKNYISFKYRETNAIFAKEFSLLIQKTDMGIVEQVIENEVNRWKDDWFLEGKAEGKLEGKAEGKLEGKFEGKLDREKELVRDMINYHYSDKDIAKLIKLPINFVKGIRKQN